MSERPSRVGVEQSTCSMMIFVSVGVGSQWNRLPLVSTTYATIQSDEWTNSQALLHSILDNYRYR